MFSKKKMVLVLACLLLSLSGSIWVQAMAGTNNSDEQLPIRSVTVTIMEGQRQLLIGELKKFADKYAFAYRVAPINPSGKNFSVEMWREDIKVLADNSLDPRSFEIDFYNNDCNHPVSGKSADVLVSQLERFIRKVPGAKVTVQNPYNR